MWKTNDIVIRDPFIVPCREEKVYYMFGSTFSFFAKKPGMFPPLGFYHFKSRDLKEWEGPFPSFIPDENFWADRDFWAPEVHEYKGKYYMFASFKRDGVCRGTQILVSDTLDGRFQPLTEGPVTPREWECLDGTLYVNEEDIPYIVFCHEWAQVHDGEILAMQLTHDLKYAAGDPFLLFKASEAGWCCEYPRPGNFVTDGPFLFRRDGKLNMLWSSFYNGKYTMGCAYSSNGKITGDWIQEKELVFTEDGGHGMLFRTWDGKEYFSLHQPNSSTEHPFFLDAERYFASRGSCE